MTKTKREEVDKILSRLTRLNAEHAVWGKRREEARRAVETAQQECQKIAHEQSELRDRLLSMIP